MAVCTPHPRPVGRLRGGGRPRVEHGAADPARPEVDGGRPGRGPRPVGGVARRRCAAGPRPAGGRAVRAAALAGGAAAGERRGVDALRPVRASAAAARRLPRPLGLRAAAVARHDGPADPADVPGVPAGVPGGERRRDRAGLRDPVLAGLDARPGAAAADRPAGDPLLGVRGPVLAGRPVRAGPGRRSGHGGRGVGARRADHQGLRPAPQPDRGVPREGARAAPYRTAQGEAAGGHLGADHDAARGRHRRGADPRDHAGVRRRAVGRHPRRVPDHRARAALAGGVAGLPAGDQQRVGDGGRPVLRGDRRRGGRRVRPRRPAGRGPGRGAVRGRALPLPGRAGEHPRPAARHRSAHPPRRDDGAGRRHRLRQDHAHRADPPAARRHRWPDHARRRGHLGAVAGAAARAGRGRLRGADAVLRDRPGERGDGRGTGRRRRGGRAAGAGHRPVRLRRPAAARPGHPGRRAGPEPVRRAAAAARAGPRRRRQSGLPGAGRPAVRAGRAHRGARRGRAARGPGGDHRARRGAPAVHGHARRPRRPDVRGPHHRRRHPSRTAHRERGVPPSDVRRQREERGPMTSVAEQTGQAGSGEEPAGAVDDPIRPPAPDDPFTKDVLPSPKGAQLTLLKSLLTPHTRRVRTATVLLLVQQAAVQAGPLLVAYAIDRAIPALRDGRHGPLILLACVYLGCALASGLLQRAFIRVAARVSQDVLIDLRGRIFRHAQALSLDFHERYTSGRLIARATSDVESLRELLTEGLEELLGVILSSVYISVILLWLDWKLGLAALFSCGPLYLMIRSFQKRSMVVYRKRSTAIAAVIVKFTETMNGIRPVQAFRREKPNEADFAELNGTHERINGDAILEMARYVVGSRLMANTAIAGIVVWGAYRVAGGGLALGVLAAFVLYLRRLYDPIDRLGMFLNSYQSAAASLEKIAGLLAQRPSVPEPAEPRELPGRGGELPGREVLFDGVRFAYRTGGEILPVFDLRIPAGQTVAVVGATGAGKSTLAKLLARFYDPTDGRITLDGVPLRELALPELRRGVVMVTQEAFLFSGTVAENIAIGRPDAGREEVERAAKAIGAHDFISALPDGYDTDVRKRGGRISAGQRQLVAFARALLADPAVLILDEATSSLDVPGERAVQQAMDTVLRGRTAVIIAHRLSTVEIADRVLVMEGGRIVEDGAPSELIADHGRFADLHAAWRDSLV
ncbi:ABC transporter transmembrane domain-containing protein [Streptomyces sp. RKAG337]|uniref:ABC transporter transmembrane domain-containing protein n=1 Tax=Streptomyces sp. RKAG337 TaxID=2893404 RepID=UPI0035A8C0F5